MKKCQFALVIVCFFLTASCGIEGVSHTGDRTGSLYAVWSLETKKEANYEVNYSDFHFFLAFGEFPFPHAIAKKGSFSSFDLKDVDVDGVRFTYNADKKKISFKKTLWLSEGLTHHMRLSGTYDVVELTDNKLVLQQDTAGSKTVYSYRKYK